MVIILVITKNNIIPIRFNMFFFCSHKNPNIKVIIVGRDRKITIAIKKQTI